MSTARESNQTHTMNYFFTAIRSTFSAAYESIVSIIERHPRAGYIGAITPTAAGFWVWVEQLTKLGALASIVIGICVGLITWKVQRANLAAQRLQQAKLEAEIAAIKQARADFSV